MTDTEATRVQVDAAYQYLYGKRTGIKLDVKSIVYRASLFGLLATTLLGCAEPIYLCRPFADLTRGCAILSKHPNKTACEFAAVAHNGKRGDKDNTRCLPMDAN